MVAPSGSAVLLGFAELNQTMNGPFSGTSVAPIATIANVFAVSRLNETDVPHHCRDTESPYCHQFPNEFILVGVP